MSGDQMDCGSTGPSFVVEHNRARHSTMNCWLSHKISPSSVWRRGALDHNAKYCRSSSFMCTAVQSTVNKTICCAVLSRWVYWVGLWVRLHDFSPKVSSRVLSWDGILFKLWYVCLVLALLKVDDELVVNKWDNLLQMLPQLKLCGKGFKVGLFTFLKLDCSFDHKFHLMTVYCDRDAVKVIIMFSVDFPQLLVTEFEPYIILPHQHAMHWISIQYCVGNAVM